MHSHAIIGNNSVTPAHPAGGGFSSLSLSPYLSSSLSAMSRRGLSSLAGAPLALSWRNSIPQAERRGCRTLCFAPAAQDEISFPPAPILCPVIVHVKQPETCICPVGSQRRFSFVPPPHPPHYGAILSGASRYNRPGSEDHQLPPTLKNLTAYSYIEMEEIDQANVIYIYI